MRSTVRIKMGEIRWSTSVHRLEGNRGELELDVPLSWEPVEVEDKCDGFCVRTLQLNLHELVTVKFSLSFRDELLRTFIIHTGLISYNKWEENLATFLY